MALVLYNARLATALKTRQLAEMPAQQVALENFLDRVQKPSRYVGGEYGE